MTMKHKLKRTLALVLVFVLVLGMVPMMAGAQSWSGEGTSASPFLINTREDLELFRDSVTYERESFSGIYFEMTADINLNNVSWTPIGGRFFSVEDGHDGGTSHFAGNFDGAGHIISGLNVNVPFRNAGLFGFVRGGTIRNLVVIGSVNSTHPIDEQSTAGGIVGFIEYNSRIENSFASVAVTSGNRHIGGLAGDVRWDTVISNSASVGDVTGGSSAAGGLVGNLQNTSTIENAIATGNVNTTFAMGLNSGIGGLVGSTFGGNNSITNSFAIGNVGANQGRVGGLAGNLHNAIINNSFWNTGIAPNGVGIVQSSSTSNAVGRTTAEMIESNTLATHMQGLGVAFSKRASEGYYSFKPELSIFASSPNPIVSELSRNSVAVDSKVRSIIATPNGGNFTNSVSVTLTTPTTDAEIFYTLDGSTPTIASILFDAAFTLTETTTVKAIAVKDGLVDSDVLEVTFTRQATITPITSGAIAATVPVRNEAVASATATLPNTTMGTIAWTHPGGAAGANFGASRVYTAVFTLTADTGFNFNGLPADTLTVAGATSVTHPAVTTGNTVEVTVVFPATATEPGGGGTTPPPITPPPHPTPDPDPTPCCPFADVDGHWGKEYICFVFAEGLMTGTSGTTFAPNRTLSRAMVATILWRMAGEPATAFEPVFSDVSATAPDWYRTAAIWANQNGIVLGSGGRFNPYDNITREQLAAMMFRYTDFVGGDTSVYEGFNLNQFHDRTDLSGWAESYKYWAVYNELIQGRNATTLAPQGTATRAEAAAILMRFVGVFG